LPWRADTYEEFEFGRSIDRDVAGFGPVEDLVHVIGHPPSKFREIARIGHQPTRLDLIAPGVKIAGRRLFLDQRNNQLTVREKDTVGAHNDRVRSLRCGFGEHALELGRGRLLNRHTNH
jgi:hypothetical protein